MRILSLPDEMITALQEGKISEGHTRPLLMLVDRPEEQIVLFKEIMTKKLTVREAESLSRRVATERIRNKDKYLDPQIMEMERNFTESLGTRVRIEKGKEGGKVTIDFFSPDDLRALLDKLNGVAVSPTLETASAVLNAAPVVASDTSAVPAADLTAPADLVAPVDDRAPEDIKREENEDLYDLKNFSV